MTDPQLIAHLHRIEKHFREQWIDHGCADVISATIQRLIAIADAESAKVQSEPGT